MPCAAGIEPATTRGTDRAAIQIFIYRKLMSAAAAKYRTHMTFGLRPRCRFVVCRLAMAVIAWIPLTATGKFYRNNIQRAVPVYAARLIIYDAAVNHFIEDLTHRIFFHKSLE